jgi:hypothetical protein
MTRLMRPDSRIYGREYGVACAFPLHAMRLGPMFSKWPSISKPLLKIDIVWS